MSGAFRSLLAFWLGGAYAKDQVVTYTTLAELFDAVSGGTSDAYFGAYVFATTSDNKLLCGIGNRPADNDGAVIVQLNEDGTFTQEYILDEQGVHDIKLHGNNIYVLGTDAAFLDDWTYGNVYIRDVNGSWTKRRTLPNVLHVLSQTWIGNTWYVGTGAHTGDNATWKGYVFKSTDDGETWTKLTTEVTDYRVYNLAYYNNLLYAGGMTQASYYTNLAYIYTSDDDGETWTNTNTLIWARTRWLEYKNKLVAVGQDGTTIIVISTDGIESITLPFTCKIADYQANVLTQSNDCVYALGTDGIYESADLRAWAITETTSDLLSLYKYSNYLVASSSGALASIYRLFIIGNMFADAVFTVNRLYFPVNGVYLNDNITRMLENSFTANSISYGVESILTTPQISMDQQRSITANISNEFERYIYISGIIYHKPIEAPFTTNNYRKIR